MQKFLILICLFAIVFLPGCEEDTASTNEPMRVEAENFVFFTSQELYRNLHKNRSVDISEEFEIVDISRTEKNGVNYLKIEIAHHACDPETRIIWDGAVAESYPPQVFLFVQLLANENCTNETDPESKTETLLLNLDELFVDEFTAEHAIIHVANASKKGTDSDHADDPVSSDG